MAYFLDTVIPDNALFLFFSKAEQFGLFGTMTPVKGYVNKKTGKLVSPYTGLRRRALKKPDHPLSGNLFGHAGDEVASSHIQPEPVKVKKPRKPAAPSPEKLAAFKAKIAHVVAHAKVDAQHAPKQGEVYKKLYLAKLESIKGIPADLLDEAKQNVEGLFKPKTLTAEPPQGKQENSGITKNPIPDRDTEAQYEGAATSIRQLSAEDRETFRILRGTRNAAQFFHLPKAQAALDKLDVKLADLDAQKKEWESSVNFARSNNFDSEVKRATEALNQLSVISGEVYRKRIKAFEKVEHWKKLAENTSAKLEKMVKGSGNPFFDVASQSEITDPAARAQKAKDLATDGKTYQGEIDAERKSKREAKTANKVVVQKDVAEQIQAKIDNSQPKEDGPKEGERNADGLVFRNGRWHREEEKPATSARAKPAFTPVPASNGLSDDPNSPNYRFKDTGYIAGSRKEEATANIRRKAKAGERILANEIDWEEIEKNPREAKELIKKSNLFGKVNWESLREGGMNPGAGFLLDRIYASIPQEPDEDSPQKRQDYALALESLRSRMERCKTAKEILSVLSEIKDELLGVSLNEEQSEVYKKLMDVYHQKKAALKQVESERDQIVSNLNQLRHQLSSAEYQQRKRIERKWKPDPDIQKQIDELKNKVKEADDEYKAYFEAHPELQKKTRLLSNGRETYQNDLEFGAYEIRLLAEGIVQAAKAKNLISNPATRAWISLGPKFMNVVNRDGAFSGHIANVMNNRIKDWSWAEKESVTVKRATKEEIKFQLKVAEKYERKGGRKVSANSTSEFKSMFGLREVQSGNWVLNDPASAAWHVQKSTEAFADLADLLGAEDNHVSMNGRLAIAFGARGHGNAGFGGAARAQYESVQRVINLTKMGGGGALAHEWAHALDNLCIEAETGKSGADDHASENPDLLPVGPLRTAFNGLRVAMLSGNDQAFKSIKYTGEDIVLADLNIGGDENKLSFLPKEIRKAGNVSAAIKAIEDYYGDTSNMTSRAKKSLETWRRIAVAYYDRNPEGGEVRVKSGPKMSSFAAGALELDINKGKPYFAQTHEMFARAFQAYCEDKLAEQGRKNDYLSAMADNKHYVDPIFNIQWKPFPEGEERRVINAAFDKLIAALRSESVLEKAYKSLTDALREDQSDITKAWPFPRGARFLFYKAVRA